MKFFIVSDVHGFYTPMIEALNAAGFDKDNPNHCFVSLGDNFDRGQEPEQMLKWLLSLERKILVRGNHEDLILDCINRRYPEWHDWSNGTWKTILQLGKYDTHEDETLACSVAYEKLYPLIKSMVEYAETDNFVFVHSFIPFHVEEECVDWRAAFHRDWRKARWHNPFKMCEMGLWKEDKTLVFGHWHTSHMWEKQGYDRFEKTDIVYGKNYIGIDACTAASKKVNVLVVEDNAIC